MIEMLFSKQIEVPSSEHVAQIVGKSGTKIKSLRATTNTCIKTPLKSDKPVFEITGQEDDVIKAANAILNAAAHFTKLMNTRVEVPSMGETTIRLPVPKQYIGVVVGRSGSQIIKIKEQTSTRINTPKSDCLNPEFEITGTQVNIIAAKEAILEKVRQAQQLSASSKWDPSLSSQNPKNNQKKFQF